MANIDPAKALNEPTVIVFVGCVQALTIFWKSW
jgi:hypothetical protein